MKEKDPKKELEEVKKEFDEFAYIVSHDLRAPLRAINNLTQWIEEDFGNDINEEVQEYFTLLKKRVFKMDQMIEALTQYSRVNRMELEVVGTNINTIINDVKEDVESRYDDVQVDIEVEVKDIKTYKKKLYRVLSELVENAAYHNQDKKGLIINIKTEEIAEGVRITVADNGNGIPDKFKESIFNIFYTLESKEKSKTIGAGLSLVKKIVDFVNGSLDFSSEENKGTKIIINWPQ